MPTPLDIPPGVVKSDSANAARGRYTDSNFVRFVNGRPEKWKGWLKLIEDQLAGVPRGAVSWTNSGGTKNASIGTHLRLYVVKGGDLLANITPLRDSGNLTNPFSTTLDSKIVNVTDTSHGCQEDDYVRFSGASAVGGITIDGDYQVVDRVDANNYTIQHSSAATSTAGPGGGTVAYEYEIAVGSAGTILGLGWGAGRWGQETWGTVRTTAGIETALRHWSLAEYGNDLLALPSNGTLYLWEEATDDQAEVVTNAPASANAMFVTGERFVFMLGTSTPMTVDWPDQDDITDWTPTASNTANTRTLQAGSSLVAGTRLADLLSLVWSDTGVYLFQYTGSDFVYEDRLLGTNCGLISPLGFAVVSGTAYWMSTHHFHFSGGGAPNYVPNAEDVRAFVYGELDQNQASKTWCAYNETANEVIWGYVSTSSADGEPDRYVAVSLHDFSWTVGALQRTCAAPYRTGDDSILMMTSDGYVYSHERGLDDDESAINAYITFGLYALKNGSRNVDVVGFVPDCQRQTGDLSIELFSKDRPNSASNLDEITVTSSEGDEIEDFRLEGRHFGFTVRSNEVGGDFRLGIPQVEMQDAGERR